MGTDLMQLIGGLGLFLLGMTVMTDGLHGLAGDMLHRVLARFTGSPSTGALTGAVSTALLQSSSATTVAAVGFVGAGLLSFPQALGVIFGANLGTTVTGWLVAFLGLKLKIGALVMPLIFIGVLIRLFGHGRLQHAGLAIAGFALVFLGIATLQDGMAAYQGLVTPSDFPSDTLVGRLQLVAIGIGITLITQSSSAGVATALTAVYTGTISFPQAAALVIGMDVGTTVTAVLATIGGSAATRRTGYSHVVYNLLTAIAALLLLTPYTWVWNLLAPGAIEAEAEFALVGFHSLFNLLGVLAVLPFANRFAGFMQRLVPEPADPVIDRLDRQLLGSPTVALDNVGRILADMTRELLQVLSGLIRQQPMPKTVVATLGQRLDAVHAFVDRIHLPQTDDRDWGRLNAAIHMLDHLQRLHERCDEEPDRAAQLVQAASLDLEAGRTVTVIEVVLADLDTGFGEEACQRADDRAVQLEGVVERLRWAIMAEVASGALDVAAGTQQLEGLRWLRRVGYHMARVCEHGRGLWSPSRDGASSQAGGSSPKLSVR